MLPLPQEYYFVISQNAKSHISSIVSSLA